MTFARCSGIPLTLMPPASEHENGTSFGQRIRESREQQGWTQDELALLCGLRPTARTISGWERGEHMPKRWRSPQLKAVAAALRVTPRSLFYGKEE